MKKEVHKYSYNTSNRIVNCLLSALICLSCNQHQQYSSADRAFYYWKTVFKLNPYEKEALHALKVTTVYLKFFDVDWDAATGKPVPKAVLQVADTAFFRNEQIEIVPTIFITNECMAKMGNNQVQELAAKIKKLSSDLLTKSFSQNTISEIQFDCDWSASTKEKYFALLHSLKGILGVNKISATIRLHQIKYRLKSGVPPVSKGMLMCYNMGNLKNPASGNSIIDADEFIKYSDNLDSYPLPLDVALPLFQWKVLFRNNQFSGLMQQLPTDSLLPSFTKQLNNHIEMLMDKKINGYQLKKGDVIRIEESNYNEIMRVGSALNRKLTAGNRRLILFHLDSVTLKKYSTNDLENIYNSLH